MTRETFLARKNIKNTDTVTLSDGASVKIRKLTQAEVEHSRRHYTEPAKQLAGLRYVVATCTLNDDGTPMFTTADMDSELTGMSFDDINAIAVAVGQFSGTYQNPNA